MKTEFYQQLVWPLAIRLIHWVFALAFVVLAVTGWLLGSGMVLNPGLHEVLRLSLHVPAGQLTVAALVGRLLLLALDRGVAGWRALMPSEGNRAARGGMLRFYLALGRREMPGFFAHDPLWALIYPVFFLLLGLQALSGFGMYSQGFRQLAGLSLESMSQWHARLALILIWTAGLHVASVLLREIRGRGYEMSSMLHGYRIFGRDRDGAVNQGDVVNIPVDQLLGSKRKTD